LIDPTNAYSSSFFGTWFCVRTRVRWVALVMSACFVRID